MFITFEGGEGAGKTTQIQKLSEFLSQQNIKHFITRQPGGTEGGAMIRKLLLDSSMPDWDPMTEYMLLLADRQHHVTTQIKPALERGEWVICDRYQDSSWVYQGWSKGVELEKIESIYNTIFGDFAPDLTIILDIPASLGQERMQQRGGVKDRMERENIDFHEKIREGYLEIARKNPERCHVIDATQGVEEVYGDVVRVITPLAS